MTRNKLTRGSAALPASIGALALMAGMAHADFVINDDLVVTGSTCTGFDCVNGEDFGFDTLRLKENNTRMQFNDTSVGSFPTNNWQIRANSSSGGGPNFLGFVDQGASGTSESGTIVLAVTANAAANSLFVGSNSNVGFGTGAPVLKLHTASGNTPGLRLEQNGTSGFTPQTWDVAGNETNFFVRDATNGSRLPFRIQPNAVSNTLFIASNSNIGMGTSAPTSRLHVVDSTSNVSLLKLENTNGTATGVGFILDPSGGTDFWQMTATADANIFRINRTGGNGVEFEVNNLGNLTISGGLISSGGGGACTVGDPCDAVFDPEVYTVPSIADHAAEMWAKGHLPAVGPTEPDQPLNMTVKMLRMLNELEHAHIYIEQLHAELGTQNQRIEALERMVAAE